MLFIMIVKLILIYEQFYSKCFKDFHISQLHYSTNLKISIQKEAISFCGVSEIFKNGRNFKI